ncbi:hypothetical protein POVCU2_0016310 [Plasmodium ovale curtisi]|uniref:Uncharacterized protein n=1 Tax=Plasmodium ovale curtisi TaxID=864141 RepID=A0A1A8VUZ1_PLAOA|nr:hypothetical protein POVCU2_0016310 [Plasmodium ovale curtisi]SBS87435.1 hypothetical protein POVCU1_014530 [Plasmodium ovale curtisi]
MYKLHSFEVRSSHIWIQKIGKSTNEIVEKADYDIYLRTHKTDPFASSSLCIYEKDKQMSGKIVGEETISYHALWLLKN